MAARPRIESSSIANPSDDQCQVSLAPAQAGPAAEVDAGKRLGCPARGRRSSGNRSARSSTASAPARVPRLAHAQHHEPGLPIEVADQATSAASMSGRPRTELTAAETDAVKPGPVAGACSVEASCAQLLETRSPWLQNPIRASSSNASDEGPQGPEDFELRLLVDGQEQIGLLGRRRAFAIDDDDGPAGSALGHESPAGLDRVSLPVPGMRLDRVGPPEDHDIGAVLDLAERGRDAPAR